MLDRAVVYHPFMLCFFITIIFYKKNTGEACSLLPHDGAETRKRG